MNCNTTSFYDGIDPSTTPIETIAERISNHNRISYDDCWDAIKVLDEDPTNAENVILIYSQRSAPKNTSGLSTGWNREHVWPKSYGVGYTGPDFSDLHHLFPADWNVNSARGNKILGNCENSDCESPAHAEASNDTASNSIIFTPPDAVKGDLARALMYMALRYNGELQDVNTENLTMSECPCQYTYTSPGYLSTLIEWHEQDPVDEQERKRTDDICRLYQGNRNPFVDMPSLVQRIFGASSSSNSSCPSCEENTETTVHGDTQCNSDPKLYISAVVESVGYNKLLEIWNPTNTTFRMATGGFQLKFCANGCTSPPSYDSTYSFESDTVLAPYESLIVCHTSFDQTLLPNGMSCDITTGSLSFNGNDLIALTCTDVNGTTVLDSIGDVSMSSDDLRWSVCDMTSNMLADITIIRDCLRNGGTSDWNVSRNCQWSVYNNPNEGLYHLYSVDNSSR